MDETSIRLFENPEFGEIRTMDEGGNPLFCAKDVATALGYANTNDAINRHCKGVGKLYPLQTDGGTQDTRFISEGDMYRLVASSKLEGAQRFESWIFDDVVPTIRRHGVYATPQTVEAMLADPDTMIRTLTALKAERERSALLSEDNARLLPKATAYDVAIEADGTMSVTECARYLAQSDRSITRTWLFAHLRADGILCKRGNAPTREAIDRGYAVQMLSTRTNGRANPPYARMTRKGYDWCRQHYTREVTA